VRKDSEICQTVKNLFKLILPACHKGKNSIIHPESEGTMMNKPTLNRLSTAAYTYRINNAHICYYPGTSSQHRFSWPG
jgi:hypothetical protein